MKTSGQQVVLQDMTYWPQKRKNKWEGKRILASHRKTVLKTCLRHTQASKQSVSEMSSALFVRISVEMIEATQTKDFMLTSRN